MAWNRFGVLWNDVKVFSARIYHHGIDSIGVSCAWFSYSGIWISKASRIPIFPIGFQFRSRMCRYILLFFILVRWCVHTSMHAIYHFHIYSVNIYNDLCLMENWLMFKFYFTTLSIFFFVLFELCVCVRFVPLLRFDWIIRCGIQNIHL